MNSLAEKNFITEQKVQFYQKNGFVQVDNVLDEQEIAQLRVYLDEAMDEKNGLSIHTDEKGGSYYRVLNQKVNTWRDHAGMARYVSHPRFANMARKLSDSNGIRLFHDQALFKMPGDSKPTPWHQDFPYWPMNKSFAKQTISIWIALDDVDENNGCMMFLPKSHEVGELKPINLAEPEDIFNYDEADALEKKPIIVKMKAGSCTFHNGLTFHYAHANQTNKPRRALVMIYMADGTTYNNKKHIITDNLNLTKDDAFSGGIFPLLA